MDSSLTALRTDLYQLTMAAGYHRLGRAEEEAVFTLYFRSLPFGGGYAIAAGLESVVAYLEHLRTVRFTAEETDYLATLTGTDGQPIFGADFCTYLRDLRFSLDVDAIPEGTAVFPYEPLIRVRGSLLQAQLVETALLNLVNFPTLIATKAARICDIAAGREVMEFGLRRAQGPDGALTASRAAYIGGAASTSNVEAGHRLGIPVRGTHAHSWVLSYEDETEAFAAYAGALPNNVVLLVDTYDTLAGVDHAIAVGHRLREAGHSLAGIRLDSGDLAYLSIEARAKLDAAGFESTRIIVSNDLDETTIESLIDQGAAIDGFGVGTMLVTAYDQPALGGVYKLTAIADGEGGWRHPIKVSEQPAKISVPGILGVRRYADSDGMAMADAIYDELTGETRETFVVDPKNPRSRKAIAPFWTPVDLLVPVFRSGSLVYELPALSAIRARVKTELSHLAPGVRRRLNPHAYPAGLAASLHVTREGLIEAALAAGGRSEAS